MQRGRRLAFDFGDVRIGVAVSDPDSILASPVITLQTKSEALWDEIFDLLGEYEPIALYVGRPIHLAGHESPSTQKSELFAKELQERFDLPVTLVDERLSTVAAQRQLRDAGVSSRASKKSIDQAAAVEILNAGLDIERALKNNG
ncbi:MAG: Holliday junction resolvase RuvX [Actinobacteria bacterium]|nr:Holliday junction resolvase RuvX [Actinomycetota bacterium]